MSRPWMPLYVGDYLADTGHLSAAQHGAYLLLMMHYWQKAGLPSDDETLARIAKMTPGEWRKSKPVIQALFSDGWKHKRIEFELTEATRISAAGRTGGFASGEARRRAKHQSNDRSTIDERPFNDSGNDQTNDPATKREALQPQPPPPIGIGNFRKVGEGKPSGPRHGATSPSRGTTFIRHGTNDWSVYAEDFRATNGYEPEPNKDGGYWFKTAGASPLPPKRLSG